MCLTSVRDRYGKHTAKAVMLVSGDAQAVIRAFETLGIPVILTERNPDLAAPVAYHPDMQYFFFPDGPVFTLQGNTIPESLINRSIPFRFTKKKPQEKYPGDILCNAFFHGDAIYARLDAIDDGIVTNAHSNSIHLISVRQGYAACSVCKVNDKAIITADTGLADACSRNGTEVLQITSGHIDLPGYDHGFIGGCSGKIGEQIIAFSGSLMYHPDGKKIREFIQRHHLEVLELTDEPLLDIGGMMDIGKWIELSGTGKDLGIRDSRDLEKVNSIIQN